MVELITNFPHSIKERMTTMKSIKNLIHLITQTINRMKKGQLTPDDKANIITFSVVLIASAISLALLIKYWVLIVLIALGIYVYKSERKQTENNAVPFADTIVYNCLYQTLHAIHDRIGVRQPIDVYDIAHHPSIVMKNTVEMVRAEVTKFRNSPVPEEELIIIRKHLQARINADLQQGKVAYIPTPSPDGRIPTIVIDDVMDNGTHFQIDVVLVDSVHKIKYLYWKHQQKNKRKDQSHHLEDKDF